MTYWGLRAYGTDPQVWGGDPDCVHQFTETNGAPVITGGLTPKQMTNAGSYTGNSPSDKSTLRGNGHVGGGPKLHSDGAVGQYQAAATCTGCGAWRGELGSEPTPEQYVANIVAVFRAVRRVLHDTGTIWCNLGDSYASGEVGRVDAPQKNKGLAESQPPRRERRIRQDTGLKPKDLVGIPWRVAFALQADGWYLRSDIIWHKPNPMPESVTDRPTKSHEYLFLLSKRAEYYYDQEAIREPLGEPRAFAGRAAKLLPCNDTPFNANTYASGYGLGHRSSGMGQPPAGRNRRSVWSIATEAYPAAHFATFPRKLVEPCVLAGTSARGQCPACGAPWRRCTEPTPEYTAKLEQGRQHPSWKGERRAEAVVIGNAFGDKPSGGVAERVTTGWESTCQCDAGDPVPQTVCDPFAGSGTTLAVARWHQRRAVGIELNPEYARLIEQRLAQGVLL